jgi:ribonuclease PH
MEQATVREDGRKSDELRPVTIETGVSKYAEGSALIAAGDTRVLVTASVDNRVPGFLAGSGKGWLTAEYSMLPRATTKR